MDKLKEVISKINNLWLTVVVICTVIAVLFVITPFIKGTLVNDINRVYDQYDLITEIKTDYIAETITISTGSTSWFDVTDKTKTYKLQKVYLSSIIEIDNSVYAPTIIDGILHIPDTYPR